MTETPTTPEKELATSIERNISEILAEWKNSPEQITFPEKVVYPSGFELEKLDKRTAANAFTGAFDGGDICFLVSTANFNGNALTDTGAKRPSKDEEAYAIFTIFPANFASRCQELGRAPRTVVQNAMIDALYQDARLQVRSQKGEVKRTQTKIKGRVGILEKRT